MSQYSSFQRRPYLDLRQQLDQEQQPFFKPVKFHPLPLAKVQTCVLQGQRLIFVTVQEESSKLLDDLLFFLGKKCTLQGYVNDTERIEELAINFGVDLRANDEQHSPKTNVIDTGDFLCKVNKVIDDNLSSADFNGCKLAKQLYCCEMQLYRKLKKLANLSTANYIKRYRLHKSIEMLQVGKDTITEICFNVGFHSLEYFSRSFKKEFGVCPNDYRNFRMLK